VAEVPLTPIAVEAFRNQLSLAGSGDWLFPSHRTAGQHYKSAKGIWRAALRKAGVSYFRIYGLRSTYATGLSAGDVADEWVVQLLRQGNSDVFKKYSQMKLTTKREALQQINRRADEMTIDEAPAAPVYGGFGTALVQ
jgi:integrase